MKVAVGLVHVGEGKGRVRAARVEVIEVIEWLACVSGKLNWVFVAVDTVGYEERRLVS